MRWDNSALEYLTSAGWDAAGPFAAVQSRDQHDLQVLGIDPGSGATVQLSAQHDDAWVTLVPGLPARTAAGTLLTSADLGDTRRLLAGGQPVSPPGLQLEAVVAVDGDTVLFTASDEPTQTHLWAYEPSSGVRRLSAEPGVHTGTRRGGCTVLDSGTPDQLGTVLSVRTPPRIGADQVPGAGAGAAAQDGTAVARPARAARGVVPAVVASAGRSAAAGADGSVRRPGRPQGHRRARVVDIHVAVVRRAGLRGPRRGRPRHAGPGPGLGAGHLPGHRRTGTRRPGAKGSNWPPRCAASST